MRYFRLFRDVESFGLCWTSRVCFSFYIRWFEMLIHKEEGCLQSVGRPSLPFMAMVYCYIHAEDSLSNTLIHWTIQIMCCVCDCASSFGQKCGRHELYYWTHKTVDTEICKENPKCTKGFWVLCCGVKSFYQLPHSLWSISATQDALIFLTRDCEVWAVQHHPWWALHTTLFMPISVSISFNCSSLIGIRHLRPRRYVCCSQGAAADSSITL